MPPESPAKGSKYSRIGKFELIKHVATGGMGAVYRARDTELNREVALKVLPADKAQKPVLIKRFEREAVVGSKLNHDNVVTFYEHGEANGFYYMALEFIEGVDLHQYIHRKGRLSVKESTKLIIQATRALAHLYDLGIVHRDVKPSNFLITVRDGKALLKLIDLGLAKEVDDDEGRVTKDGTTLGTVDYMSPEQAKDASTADVRADIYSLGCTWYHMLAGKPPFPEGSLAERLYKHVEVQAPDVRESNPDVPDEVVDVLKRMLAKKPEHRYATPAELLKDLEDPKKTFKPISTDLLSGLAAGEDHEADESDAEDAPPPVMAAPKPRPRSTPSDRSATGSARKGGRKQGGESSLQTNLIVAGGVLFGLVLLAFVLFKFLR